MMFFITTVSYLHLIMKNHQFSSSLWIWKPRKLSGSTKFYFLMAHIHSQLSETFFISYLPKENWSPSTCWQKCKKNTPTKIFFQLKVSKTTFWFKIWTKKFNFSTQKMKSCSLLKKKTLMTIFGGTQTSELFPTRSIWSTSQLKRWLSQQTNKIENISTIHWLVPHSFQNSLKISVKSISSTNWN